MPVAAGADHEGPEVLDFVLRKPQKGFPGENDGDSD